MSEIVSFIVSKVIDYLPTFLVRIFYRSGKIARQLQIRLRNGKPISVNLDGQVPTIDIYFEVMNFSNFSLVLDRVLIDLWFGQPTLKGCLLKRYKLSPRNISKPILYSSDLTQAQCSQIKRFLDSDGTHGQISLNIIAYFESKVGLIELEQRFERSTL